MYGEYILALLCLVICAHIAIVWRMAKDAKMLINKSQTLNNKLASLQTRVQRLRDKQRIHAQGYADDISRLN